MFTFAYPILLILLVLVPLLWLLYRYSRRSRAKRIREFGRPEVLAHLMPDLSPYKPAIRFTLRACALGLLIIALARPWGGLIEQSANREGIEVMAVVDVSNSMLASATSDANGTSRMETAKLMLERMVDGMGNDRVGLVIFAGDAYQLIPVSSDYVSVKSFLSIMDPTQVTAQGTNIADAIDMAVASFTEDSNIGKAIVLITDAEELDDEQEVMKAVKEARARNIQINVVGVGSSQPTIINTPQGAFTDDDGNVVQTKLNEELGRQIAKEGKGVYVNASSSNALPTVQRQLKDVKRTTLSTNHLALHDELFVYFAALALILLAIDACMVDRKNSVLRKITFFHKEDKR